MTSRNKLKLQQVDDTPEEWIWGNHRGGGGAPLKDVYGNSVANLKKVLQGEAEIDVSPSGIRKNAPRRYEEEEEIYPPAKFGAKPQKLNRAPRFREEEDAEDTGYDRRDRRNGAGGGGRGNEDEDYGRNNKSILKKPPRGGGGNNRRYDEEGRGEDDYPRGGGRREERNSHPNSRRNSDSNYSNDDNSHYSNNHQSYRNNGAGNRKNNAYDDPPPSNYIPPNPNTPKKFMSGVQELNGITDRDRQEKAKRALEYQNQLKRQIEENNRRKELEKQKEEEIKRREYDEYMQAISPNRNNNNPDQKPKKKVPLFKPEGAGGDNYPPIEERDRRRDDHDDYGKPKNGVGKGVGRGGRASNAYDDDDDDRAELDDYSPREANGKGQKKKKLLNYDSDSEQPPSPNRKAKLVSADEYDELSKLCDKLLSQQETLQSEIRNQAHLIKELQKKGAVVNAGALKPPNPLLRSKSVQQSRPGNNNNINNHVNGVKSNEKPSSRFPANEERSKSNARPRPASMYEGSKQPQINGNNINNNNPGIQKKVEQKKVLKSAFGHAVISDNKQSVAVGAKNTPVSEKKSAVSSLRDKVPSLNKPAGKGRDSEGGGGMAVNGFAKLQAKVNHQPLIVSYDDDEGSIGKGGGGVGKNHRPSRRDNYDDDGNDGRSSLNLELRGQSRYVPVGASSFDEIENSSYNSKGRRGGGDQLDKLIANTKKGKFA